MCPLCDVGKQGGWEKAWSHGLHEVLSSEWEWGWGQGCSKSQTDSLASLGLGSGTWGV